MTLQVTNASSKPAPMLQAQCGRQRVQDSKLTKPEVFRDLGTLQKRRPFSKTKTKTKTIVGGSERIS